MKSTTLDKLGKIKLEPSGLNQIVESGSDKEADVDKSSMEQVDDSSVALVVDDENMNVFCMRA